MEHTKIYEFCEKHCITNLEIKYRGGLEQFGLQGTGATCKLEISQADLIKLIEYETRAQKLVAMINEEREMREKYASVKKAYEEYQLLLAITQEENK